MCLHECQNITGSGFQNLRNCVKIKLFGALKLDKKYLFYLRNLQIIKLINCNIHSHDVKFFEKCHSIYLRACPIDDECLKYLSNFFKIKIHIGDISGKFVSYIKNCISLKIYAKKLILENLLQLNELKYLKHPVIYNYNCPHLPSIDPDYIREKINIPNINIITALW